MERLYQKKIQLGIVLALIWLGSIGGYLAYGSFQLAPAITIENNLAIPQGVRAPLYVASIRGSVYYLSSCGAADRIHEKNKRYFSSRAAAQDAGLTPSKLCKEISLFP